MELLRKSKARVSQKRVPSAPKKQFTSTANRHLHLTAQQKLPHGLPPLALCPDDDWKKENPTLRAPQITS